jgi:hypothetical protein
MLRTVLAVTLGATMLIGCAVAESDSNGSNGSAMVTDPDAMPGPILTFLNTEGWGDHHLEWHTVRQWDRMPVENQTEARERGWARADLQEGAKGNGLEFLTMHRTMIRLLVQKFPKDASLFDGFTEPPTECDDPNDPCGPKSQGPFDANKAKAIDKLQNHLGDFESDDDFGLYVETGWRPTAKDPQHHSEDPSAGLHNYMHGRLQNSDSPIDVGDPSVNLQNRHFWRLHGWIENRWTEFRKIKGLSDDDPVYLAAMKKAELMFQPTMKGVQQGQRGLPPSRALRKFSESQDP